MAYLKTIYDYDQPEVLTNLNPQNTDFRMMKAHHVIPQIPWTSIAYACAIADKKVPGSSYLFRTKHCGQDYWKEFERFIWNRKVSARATAQGWKHPAPKGVEWNRLMTRLAIWENIHHHVCPSCLGRAQALISDKLHKCPDCNTDGRRVMTDKDRAEFMSISAPAWDNTWERRYRRIQMDIIQIESHGFPVFLTALGY